jgi:hypothetical protein
MPVLCLFSWDWVIPLELFCVPLVFLLDPDVYFMHRTRALSTCFCSTQSLLQDMISKSILIGTVHQGLGVLAELLFFGRVWVATDTECPLIF